MNLTYGSQGQAVKALQNALKSAGYDLTVDGIYDEKTRNAVEDYQRKNGLDVSGIADDRTQTSLLTSSGKQTKKPKKKGARN